MRRPARSATYTSRRLGDGPEPLVDVADLLDDRRRLDPVVLVVASWISRRRFVSSIAACIDSVTRSAYMTTSPPMFRAARPIIWINDQALRRKPSLSASRIATRVTSGRSMPSRSRLIPTTTSKTPSRRSRRICDPLERVDLGVEVLDLDPELAQVVGQVLGHPLRERRDDRPLAAIDPAPDLLEQVVDLALGRADADRRVDDAGRADQLLDDPFALLELVRARAWRSCRSPGGRSSRTPRTSAAGCRAPTAAGTRSRPGSPCASGRSCTCRRPAGSSCALSSTTSSQSGGK